MDAALRESPTRTCIGCRKRAPACELVCLVLREGRVTPVGVRRGDSGRGAWICRQVACVDEALRRRAFGRAFRTEVRLPDNEELKALVLRASETRLSTKVLAP